ncbi:Protein arginine methyltransferase NDUFAF7, mitochondrial [Nymphon striatum]|nr:Protein arginine methyltransferase NDUFAF7, mitochondrial [Nymphon striatum]
MQDFRFTLKKNSGEYASVPPKNFKRLKSFVRCHQKAAYPKSNVTPLLKQLEAKLRLTGPITIADYMKEVLVNPVQGYYMSKDVFGPRGDFVTSPEISQIFGELIAVWFLLEWKKMGECKPLHIIELGPGRGTLSSDLLRVISKYSDLSKHVSLHFVEVSPHLRAMQEELLCKNASPTLKETSQKLTHHGIPVHWYSDLKEVPPGFTCLIANEFFDALPIHKFVKKESGWKEVLIDVDFDSGPHHLKYVLSNGPTPASKIFIQVDLLCLRKTGINTRRQVTAPLVEPHYQQEHYGKQAFSKNESKDQVEVCPKAGIITQDISRRIKECGGCALIADYGHCGDNGDTFRAFKNHKLHHPLCEPGTADLTASVDFSYINRIVADDAISFGPISQESFLKSLGIKIRFQKLMKVANPEEEKTLRSAYEMLIDPCDMGGKFKFLAIFPAVLKDFLIKFPPTGFSSESTISSSRSFN